MSSLNKCNPIQFNAVAEYRYPAAFACRNMSPTQKSWLPDRYGQLANCLMVRASFGEWFLSQSPTDRSRLYWQPDGFLLCLVHTVILVTPKVSPSQETLTAYNSAGLFYSPCTHASVLNLLASVVPSWICTQHQHHYWFCLQLRFLKHWANLYASISGDVTNVIVILHKKPWSSSSQDCRHIRFVL